ncbi:MAG TPA: transporter substrate-binding domain-containing protein [Candidatus Acidoferrales bacterium]|nr:transporter substrate-binding domain-containing protein [Candidatus Acidoferrales bacterium]
MIKIGLVLGFVFASFVVINCNSTTLRQTPAMTADLAPTGKLRVALFTANPVVASKNSTTGEITGPSVILGRALAANAGVPLAPIEYTAIAKLVEDAKFGVWDVAVVAVDPSRRAVLDYAPSHLVVDLTYLVPPGSPIRRVPDADQPGNRIAVARGAATGLILERSLKQATLTPAENEPAAFELIRQGKAQAYAQNRFLLLGLVDRLPGARVLDDGFASIEIAFALPKGREAALAYVSAFVKRAKASGDVARAIEAAGIRGVRVPPTQ